MGEDCTVKLINHWRAQIVPFLRESAWIFYTLYFQPTALTTQLRQQITGLEAADGAKRLLVILDKLDQAAALRYLAHLALLCAVAALPFGAIAPWATTPPAFWLVLLTWAMITLAGLGAALLQGAWGPATAWALGIALAFAPMPGAWFDLAHKALTRSQTDWLWGIVIGASVGFLCGGIGGWLARCNPAAEETIIGVAGIVAVVVAGIVAGVVMGVVASSVAVVVAGVVTVVVVGAVAGGVAVVVASGVASIIAGAMTGGVAGVATFVVAGDVVSIMAVGLAFLVAFVGPVVVAFIVESSMAGIVAFVVAGVVANVVAVGVVVVVTVAITDVATAAPWYVIGAAALVIGIALGAWRWSRATAPLSLALLLWLALAFPPAQLPSAVLGLAVGLAGFLRLPFWLWHSYWSVSSYGRCRWLGADALPILSRAPWHWDELVALPLPLLEPLLVLAVQQDRQQGLAYIEEVAATWRQGGAARRALVQLAANELTTYTSERALADAADALRWLPQTLPQPAADTLGRFRTVSRLVEEKMVITETEAQLVKLSAATAELDSLIRGLTFVPASERARFLPIAQSWRTVLKKATSRLPNPYVAGDPLRSAELFIGREDLLPQLEAHLRDRSQRPALLLFGQRRMGKSSLLYQLPTQLGDTVVPVRLDCQAGELVESNGAFLFNLGRTIHSQAAANRNLALPAPPALAESTFTAFHLWLEAVETVLGQRSLLLSLDEFEGLGAAVQKGWLDERVLGFLRNLIQHHPQIDLLLAGSHRPQELGLPWSSYLISVQVLEIAYLDPQATRRLIEQPIPGFGLHYQPAAVDQIIALTRCQPLLVQLLCQELVHLLNERGDREATLVDIAVVIPRAFTRGSTLYFQYLHDDAGPEGNAILTRLAKAGPNAALAASVLTGNQPTFQAALQRLLARDLVEEVEGGIRFEVELVRLWWESNG